MKRQFCRSEKMKMLYGRGELLFSVPTTVSGCGVTPYPSWGAGLGSCRPDKTRQVASGTECRMRRERLIRPTVLARVL